jgi:SAM-dependent methyltransferase
MGTGGTSMNTSPAAAAKCAVCDSLAGYVGSRAGTVDGRRFDYFHCPACRFTFVGNARTDYTAVYDEAYYRGHGADPLVDYLYELENPDQTIRNYEWRGLLSIFSKLQPVGGRWLDFGCGAGGLVRTARAEGIDCVGFEEGWGSRAARERGIPVLDAADLPACAGQFGFVTAIEVLEHVVDPVRILGQIRSLLSPRGMLFLTTGNAEPWRGRILEWSYARIPDVHVSFYEPATLSLAMSKAGLRAVPGRYMKGHTEIIKYKVLKSVGIRRTQRIIDFLPWSILSRLVDLRYGVSAQPMGTVE